MQSESAQQPLVEWGGRAVMLLDLDAFFASVEQLDHPQWRGRPVIVGGDAQRRGVVSTCSYEARAFGVRSAMPSSTAARLCPDAIWVPGRFDRYRQMSDKVMQIMRDESPFLQQVSIDEAFLDITPTPHADEDPVAIARRIQKRVDALGITCSIGLGVSKSVAKVASDIDKPRGLTVVYPGNEASFLAPLPCGAMSGIGPVAQRRLKALGISTLGQIASADPALLKPIFGKAAQTMQDRCKGADADPVEQGDAAKSVSNEISFAKDLQTRKDIVAAIATVAAKVARRLRLKGLVCSSVSLKVRYADRSVHSAQASLAAPSNSEYVFMQALESMLDDLWAPGMKVRLVGMTAFNFDGHQAPPVQESLFGNRDTPAPSDTTADLDSLSVATDRVRDRFGEDAVLFGRELRTKGNLTGSSSKNPADYKD